tara:strand:- start:1316 stop:1657 length:342 start_codon:yes stop_codon:yes gene_type:complete
MTDKIVRASDASLIKRLSKKYLGSKFLADMTDKQLQEVHDKPDSVFGKMKRQGNVGAERARRKSLLDKSYKDKITRDQTKPKLAYDKTKRFTSDELKRLKAFVKAIKEAKSND